MALWEARAEEVARQCKGVWVHLTNGKEPGYMLACWSSSRHANEGTWPLRETPLESVQTFRGKGHLLAEGQTADKGVDEKREVKNVSVFGVSDEYDGRMTN